MARDRGHHGFRQPVERKDGSVDRAQHGSPFVIAIGRHLSSIDTGREDTGKARENDARAPRMRTRLCEGVLYRKRQLEIERVHRRTRQPEDPNPATILGFN